LLRAYGPRNDTQDPLTHTLSPKGERGIWTRRFAPSTRHPLDNVPLSVLLKILGGRKGRRNFIAYEEVMSDALGQCREYASRHLFIIVPFVLKYGDMRVAMYSSIVGGALLLVLVPYQLDS